MSLVLLPRNLVVDINGTPRNGAKVFVYDAGTSTPRPAYPTAADAAAETNPLTQPIPSVSTGIFPAMHVNPAGGPYKIILKDSSDSTLYTEDNLVADPGVTHATVGTALYPLSDDESGAGLGEDDIDEPATPYLNTRRYGTAIGSTLAVALDVVNAGSGGEIVIPKGTSALALTVNKTMSSDVRLIFEDGALLDATGLSSYAAIRLSGSEGTAVALDSDAEVGDRSLVSAALAAQVEAGDVIRIICTDLWIDSDPSFDQPKGELCEVVSVSGSTVNLLHPLEDGYDNATTTLAKLTAPRITVEGLEIERNINNGVALEIYNARDVNLIGGRFTGCKDRCVRLQRVLKGKVDGITTHGIYDASDVSTNYGLSIISSMDIEVCNSYLHAGRHGLMTGGFEPTRRVLVRKNVISNDLGAQSATHNADTHYNTDKIDFVNNDIYGGLGLRAPNCSAINNRVRHCGITGEYNTLIYYDPAQRNGRTVISGNNLEKLKVGAGDNTFGIRVGGDQINCTTRQVIVDDNTLRNIPTAFNVPGLTQSGASIGHLKITNNIGQGITRLSVEVDTATSPIGHLEVSGNHLDYKGEIAFTGVLTMHGNRLSAGGSNRWDLTVYGDIDLANNRFKDFSANGGVQVDGKYLDNITSVGNIYLGTGLPSLGRPRNKLIMGTTPNGATISGAISSVAPGFGQWTTGDVVYKATMAASGKIAYVCTTAGYGVRGAWGTNTYAVGEQVTNSGNLYRCVIAGTSAAAGPTHGSGEVTDGGGVRWEFISSSFTSAVFKEAGVIDA